MAVDGLWTAEFQTTSAWVNGGVIVLKANRIYGGDSQYYYLGRFTIAGDELTGSLRARHYHGQPVTPFGVQTPGFDGQVKAKLLGPGDIRGTVTAPMAVGSVAFPSGEASRPSIGVLTREGSFAITALPLPRRHPVKAHLLDRVLSGCEWRGIAR